MGYRQVLVVNAAREGARAAAVEPGDLAGAASSAAPRAGPLPSHRLRIDTREDDGFVRVEVRFVDPTDVALVGSLLPDVTLTARVTMRVER